MPQIAVKSRKHSYISRKSKQLEHSDNGYSSQSNTSIDKSARLPKLPSLARSITPNSPLDPIEDLQDQVFFNEKEKRDKEFQKRFSFFSQIPESLNRLNFRVKLGRKKSQALRSLNSEFYDD